MRRNGDAVSGQAGPSGGEGICNVLRWIFGAWNRPTTAEADVEREGEKEKSWRASGIWLEHLGR